MITSIGITTRSREPISLLELVSHIVIIWLLLLPALSVCSTLVSLRLLLAIEVVVLVIAARLTIKVVPIAQDRASWPCASTTCPFQLVQDLRVKVSTFLRRCAFVKPTTVFLLFATSVSMLDCNVELSISGNLIEHRLIIRSRCETFDAISCNVVIRTLE